MNWYRIFQQGYSEMLQYIHSVTVKESSYRTTEIAYGFKPLLCTRYLIQKLICILQLVVIFLFCTIVLRSLTASILQDYMSDARNTTCI